MTDRPGTYFTWSELRTTSTGLRNEPPPDVQDNLRRLVQEVLDPLRAELGVPVRVTSGYRSPEVNAAVGGSRTSRHMLGLAADVKAKGFHARQIVECLERMRQAGTLDFDQAIAYAASRGGHTHIGIAQDGQTPRRQLLWASSEGGYRDLIVHNQ